MSFVSVAAKRALKARYRHYSTATSNKYRVVVVGGGSGGLAIANQIYDRFSNESKPLNKGDIAILDAAEWHYYQPGWTLVGSGLVSKATTRRSLSSLIPSHLAHIPEHVSSFSPQANSVTTTSGRVIEYDALVIAVGLQIDWDRIKGLKQALVDSSSGVSSIYSYDTCDKTWNDIDSLRSGKAVFTQPAGIIKCAGAPQKIMWMAWDTFNQTSRGKNIKTEFYTGMPTMFSVKKYSEALDKLRIERGVAGHFQYNLTAVDHNNHKATFTKQDGSTVDVDYTMLHATPPMSAPSFLKGSPLVDSAGWVEVDPATMRHVKPEFGNVFAIGDCSSLPTSKTVAAITAQAPILTENLFSVMTTGDVSKAAYDGYTSCPLLTGHGQLMLAEFKYGLEPKETFQAFTDQAVPNRLFYHLKKDVFPLAYWNLHTKGKWFGSSGIVRPQFT